MKDDNPYGDDGGTRVGKPDTPDRANAQGGGDGGNTGAGKEAVRGLTNDKKGTKGAKGDSSDDSVSSGELKDRDTDASSGYGGAMGGPKTSSDKR
jgi:hypothetical protein